MSTVPSSSQEFDDLQRTAGLSDKLSRIEQLESQLAALKLSVTNGHNVTPSRSPIPSGTPMPNGAPTSLPKGAPTPKGVPTSKPILATPAIPSECTTPSAVEAAGHGAMDLDAEESLGTSGIGKVAGMIEGNSVTPKKLPMEPNHVEEVPQTKPPDSEMTGEGGTLESPNPSIIALQRIAHLPDGDCKSALMALCEAQMTQVC